MRHTSPLASLASGVAIAAFLLLSSCGGGGGGGGGGSGGPATGDVLLTDAPSDELLAFQATVSGVRLIDSSNAVTANLLDGPVELELLGLSGTTQWLVHEALPSATYIGVRLTLQAGSLRAIDKAGNDVAITENGTVLDAIFRSPTVIGSSGYRRFVVDLDLASSLSGSLSAPPLVFDPRGSAVFSNGSSSESIDEFKGLVTSADEVARTIVVDGFVEDDLSVPLGSVVVHVQGSTLLFDDNGTQVANVAAFFASLVPSSTLLEVHGALAGGKVEATRIEIEDHAGGANTQNEVEIEGLVLDLHATSLDLVIAEIDKGAAIVGPILSGLGDPTTIVVSWDANTRFFLEDDQATTAAALAIGQRVKTRHSTFVNPPFPATKIEIEDEAEFEGAITDVSGLPGSIVIHLDGDEPAIFSGQVDDPNTPVTVTLGAANLSLDTEGDPALSALDLLVGLKVEAEGALSGPTDGPTLAATKLKVHAGRFRGHVTSISRTTNSFNATVDDLKDPFGNAVVGIATVEFDPNCVIEEDASSETTFYALFNGLQAGESIEVEVEGIGTGVANEIRAFEVEAEVEGP